MIRQYGNDRSREILPAGISSVGVARQRPLQFVHSCGGGDGAVTREWADAVEARMSDLGISNRALARACDKSESTIRRWLSGADEPRGSDVRKIAERLRDDPHAAFVRLGWLPRSASDDLRLRMLDQQIRQAILRQVQVDSEPRTALGAFVDRVASEPGWAAITSHVVRGVTYPVQFEDHVELVPTRQLDHPPTREEVNDFLDALMGAYDAQWCDDPVDRMGEWDQGVIKVPRVLAARPPGDPAYPAAPKSVMVVGSHWTGNAKIASLLATVLDYGFFRMATAARLAYGVRADAPDRRADRVEVARSLFRDPKGLGRQMVWTISLDEAGDLLPAVLDKAIAEEDRPYIVYCRPNDPLVEFSAAQAKAQKLWGLTTEDHRAHREVVDASLAELESGTVTIDIDKAIRRGSVQDQYWDEHVSVFAQLVDVIGPEWGLPPTARVVEAVIKRWA